MTFSRGDIVRLRSDEQEAERCEGESSREYHRARRYIVLGTVTTGATFQLPDGTRVLWPALYEIRNPYAVFFASRFAHESDLIATGERAEEIA